MTCPTRRNTTQSPYDLIIVNFYPPSGLVYRLEIANPHDGVFDEPRMEAGNLGAKMFLYIQEYDIYTELWHEMSSGVSMIQPHAPFEDTSAHAGNLAEREALWRDVRNRVKYWKREKAVAFPWETACHGTEVKVIEVHDSTPPEGFHDRPLNTMRALHEYQWTPTNPAGQPEDGTAYRLRILEKAN